MKKKEGLFIKPKIMTITPKKMVGLKRKVTLKTNGLVARELWTNFMKSKNIISNQISSNLYSIQIFNSTVFEQDSEFQKWAAVEVKDFKPVPEIFETLEMQGGLYAVFLHTGMLNMKTYEYIFNNWLTNSDYILDKREQFEIMPPEYNPNDSNSTEEIWIPIKNKK